VPVSRRVATPVTTAVVLLRPAAWVTVKALRPWTDTGAGIRGRATGRAVG